MARAGEDPVRHRALSLRAATQGHVLGGAIDATRTSPALRSSCAGVRDRSGVRPAPQDAPPKPEAAWRRSHSAARKGRPRPDCARRGYCGRRLRRAREGNYMTRMIRQSMVAYATPLCETVAEAPEPYGTEVLVRISRCGVCHSDL